MDRRDFIILGSATAASSIFGCSHKTGVTDPVHRPRMFTRNDPLKLITHRGMIPLIRRQELLQCARRDPSV